MSMHFKTTELSKKLTHSICGCKKKKKIEKNKVKVTFTYLFSLTYTILPREDIWKTEWRNKKIIIIIPLILPFLGAKVFFSIFSKHVSQMVNRPSLQAMQMVVNGSSQISATLKTYWKYLSVHITPRLVFIYVDKKKRWQSSPYRPAFTGNFFSEVTVEEWSQPCCSRQLFPFTWAEVLEKGGRACDETHVTRTGKMRGEKNKFSCSSRELGTYGVYTSVPQLCLFPSGWREPRSHQTL